MTGAEDADVIARVIAEQLTMCSPERCEALARACRHVLREQIPGDFVATGVWRGGGAIIAASIFRGSGRRLFLYDTFDGMTRPEECDGEEAARLYAEHGSSWCRATAEEVSANLARYGLAGEPVVFVPGDIAVMLREGAPRSVAVAYLDTDFYQSTRAALVGLYPAIESGGFMFFDDYGTWPGCRKAVDEYFGSRVPLRQVSNACRYVVKP